MKRNADHSLLDKAKSNKKDEFYTQLCDIERELVHYKKHFKNKVVFCNCDDVTTSNFYKYFVQHFDELGLKKVICSCFKKCEDDLFAEFSEEKHGFYYEYDGTGTMFPTLNEVSYFRGNGDFREAEVIELLKKSDIIVTNPPFSLFREFIAQLMKFEKKFLIIGNINAITYKEVFGFIKENKVWLGVNLGRGISGFIVPEDYELYGQEVKIDENGNRIISPNNCLWLTNLENEKRNEHIPLTKLYFGNESEYPFFDNYDAINVNKTQNIPLDYNGAMGVPITFLHKFNPEQFEIIKFRKGNDGKDLTVHGKQIYFRIIIRKRVESIVA